MIWDEKLQTVTSLREQMSDFIVGTLQKFPGAGAGCAGDNDKVSPAFHGRVLAWQDRMKLRFFAVVSCPIWPRRPPIARCSCHKLPVSVSFQWQ